MRTSRPRIRSRILLPWLALFSVVLTGCATPRIAPVADIENTKGAMSVPYRFSSSGRILLDISLNGESARPFALDTGASVSVVYGDFAKALDLKVSEQTLFVRGLVGKGERPVIENVHLQMGDYAAQMEKMLMLDTPLIKDEAVGLLGGDILNMFIALFNKETQTATFVPRSNIDKQVFAGWNKIPLQIFADAQTSSRLYFANMDLDGQEVLVLVDTGSNLNFINWKLAKMDKDIEKLERKLIRDGTLQGALDSTSATTATTFYDLQLGSQNWDEINVVVMSLGALDTVAPVDEPMMVAGAQIFTPHTIAFDLEGLRLYVKPDS